jgi:deoxyribonuclease-1
VQQYVAPQTESNTYVAPPVQEQAPADSGFSCNCAKTCPNMSCAEAYFQLNTCGCSQRDGDGDGVPCEAQCR